MVWAKGRNFDLSEESWPGAILAEGILSATKIATPDGWVPAATLTAGMTVLTFDAGEQPVASVRLHAMGQAQMALWPLLVPAWALDNREPLLLLPEQKLLVEADCAEALFGDPFALIPAAALEGWRGITRVRPEPNSMVVTLGFDMPQVIYASRGTLMACPGSPLSGLVLDGLRNCADYSSFTLAQAQQLVACMIAEETGAVLRALGQDGSHPTPMQ